MTAVPAWLRKRGSVIYLTVLVLAGFSGSYYLSAHNAATLTELCQAGNVARAQQVGLWEYVLHISRPPPHETAAQHAQRERTVRAFTAHLHKVFAPRNCAHPSRTEPTP